LSMKRVIDDVEDPKVRSLLLLCWLSILERSSNAFKEGNGLKYRNKKRMPGRYISLPDNEWIPKYFGSNVTGFVENLWIQQCSMVVSDLESTNDFCSRTRIRTGSCLDPSTVDFGEKFDLVIFSPPYANRFDYFEAFKVELWMGGFVQSSEDMGQLRSQSMRSNLTARKFSSDNHWAPLQPFLEEMDSSASSVRMGIKSTLEGYFYDTRVLLRNLRPQLATQGKVVIVVGNSAYASSIIPTDVLIARLAAEEGYKAKSISVARRLHVSSQQRKSLEHCSDMMRESVVILEK
jgi:hypothetical protein